MRLTYANVMSTVAIFAALGGSSYAAVKISGKDVRDNSLTTRDVRNGSLRTRDIRRGDLLALKRGLPRASAARATSSGATARSSPPSTTASTTSSASRCPPRSGS